MKQPEGISLEQRVRNQDKRIKELERYTKELALLLRQYSGRG